MANKIDQEQEVLSPEEQLLKEQIEGLLEKVDPGHGEPLQVELAGRLDKTVNEFHDEVATIIEGLKASSDERRGKLKNMWEHRNDEIPVVKIMDTVEEVQEEVQEEFQEEISSWEKRLESKKAAEKGSKQKSAEKTDSKKEKPKKKGFFKRKK